MNFFGHATVASWHSTEPQLALGAMLPDFATMCRGRLVRVEDDDIAAGVELHHRTDAAFHRLPGFLELYISTTRRLRERGVARGGARATAHITVELFLDGLLLADEIACQCYLAAIALAQAVTDQILWREADHAMRWDHLCARLQETGLPRAYNDPDEVAERITWILARRPLLALSDEDAAIVRDEMPGLRAQVAERAEEIMTGLRAALG